MTTSVTRWGSLIILTWLILIPRVNTTTVEPLLFENIGQLVSGLSYVHTHIPINISEVDDMIQSHGTTRVQRGYLEKEP